MGLRINIPGKMRGSKLRRTVVELIALMALLSFSASAFPSNLSEEEATSSSIWDMEENYSIFLKEINYYTSPREVLFQIRKNNKIINEKAVFQGGKFTYVTGKSVINFTLNDVFGGTSAQMVKLNNINQFSEINGNILINNQSHQFITGNVSGTDWVLGQKYRLKLVDVDKRTSPGQVWLRYYRNGTLVDDRVVQKGSYYNYSNSSTNVGLILSMKINETTNGSNTQILNSENVYQFCEVHGADMVLLSNETHQFKPGEVSFANVKTGMMGMTPAATAQATQSTMGEGTAHVPQSTIGEGTDQATQSTPGEKTPGFGLILVITAIGIIYLHDKKRR